MTFNIPLIGTITIAKPALAAKIAAAVATVAGALLATWRGVIAKRRHRHATRHDDLTRLQTEIGQLRDRVSSLETANRDLKREVRKLEESWRSEREQAHAIKVERDQLVAAFERLRATVDRLIAAMRAAGVEVPALDIPEMPGSAGASRVRTSDAGNTKEYRAKKSG